jgi:mono/diheme cytochrome c family protein
LSKAQPETNEERVHQLLGLAWAGERPGRLKKMAQALIQEQRADGGWGQLAGLASDAFATGQSLYALIQAGVVTAGQSTIPRGIEFLVRTQEADGTWHVRRRAHPFQPPMDSGFAHGADGWISAAGSSWAVLALLSTQPAAILSDATPRRPEAPGRSTGVVAVKPATENAAQNIYGFIAESGARAPIEFARDIQPLFERSCAACHSGERPKGGYRVTEHAALVKGGARGEAVIVPGAPEKSALIGMVEDRLEDQEMPPLAQRHKFPALTREEIARLKQWVQQGAAGPGDAIAAQKR